MDPSFFHNNHDISKITIQNNNDMTKYKVTGEKSARSPTSTTPTVM